MYEPFIYPALHILYGAARQRNEEIAAARTTFDPNVIDLPPEAVREIKEVPLLALEDHRRRD
ncbi:hypothetical protein B0G76_2860 [Paraburkholderia sp. BL23I1N1]|uniref:hypothetical protein n=1 Tax=Paraburkholderia sp. BL23I1N1 TaxID=1938802 RepID=UPI000E720E17|nr:hypothetical protein [Paraburkholderia sp. BL23I1N1]RKE36658.1 hypothetical protein B0G76_2860 [Paraburkholderia sp. BL23I1N1]